MLQINSPDILTEPTVTPSHIHVYASFITNCVLVLIFTLYSTVLFVGRSFILRAKEALISSIGVLSSDYNT